MSPTDSQVHPLTLQMWPHLDGLLPALRGYPVIDLIDVYAQTVAQTPASAEAQRAFSLVERCIANWIDTLELSVASLAPFQDESCVRMKARQTAARSALVDVRSMLCSREHQRRLQS